MVVKRGLGVNVVTAAKQRIIETFAKGRKVFLSFSGGKDSVVLASILLELVHEEKIDKRLLTVIFIDEEAMYDDVIEIVKKWRVRFMQEGIKFIWYCLQVKHFNCLNSLTSEENFICWDKEKKDIWVRQMPPFAVTDDEFLIPYKDNYQSFMSRKCSAHKAISMRGVRVAESVQRLKNIASQKNDNVSLPIYDMTDHDIWLYILKYNVEIPKTYENLYRVGTPINNLRISQFFSIDTARSLVKLNEMYPDLMERVSRREPNAYLCSMYWDTEMFGRRTAKRKETEGEDKRDYRKIVFDLLKEKNHDHQEVIKGIRPYIVQYKTFLAEDSPVYKHVYDAIITGDPKMRKSRAIIYEIFKEGRAKKNDE